MTTTTAIKTYDYIVTGEIIVGFKANFQSDTPLTAEEISKKITEEMTSNEIELASDYDPIYYGSLAVQHDGSNSDLDTICVDGITLLFFT